MSKTLILMRHAKSDWSSGVLEDHDRPLNARGQVAAAALGDWLRSKEWLPGEVLCSTAARTRETLDRLQLDVPVRYVDALYHAGSDVMDTVLKTASAATVLMVGHNPGITEFAARLMAAPPAHRRFHDYPTGATLVARFDIDSWGTLGWGRGMPLDFIVPRELTD